MNKKDIILGTYQYGETYNSLYKRTTTILDKKEMFGELAHTGWERYLLEAIVYGKVVIPEDKKVYKITIHQEESGVTPSCDGMNITSYNVIGTVYYQ